MGRFAEIMRTVYTDSGSYEKMTGTVDALDVLMEHLKVDEPELYKKTMAEVESVAFAITKEEAENIVRHMKPKGQVWSYSDVKTYIETKGVTAKCVHWYLVMNMAYNDYYNTAKAFGLQNDVDFYFHLAKDFIEDPDAKPMKVEKYFS